MKYSVTISDSIFNQIAQIKQYIRDVLYAPAVAEKRVKDILGELRELEVFPERGFNADKKLQTEIYPGKVTYGFPIVNGKYIVLYQIDEEKKDIEIVDLLATQSDYAKLFL